MKTLIICATADEAGLLERTFFRPDGNGENNTVCVGAGSIITGYHFHRIIYMPGWARVNPRAHEWNRLSVQSRKADKHFHLDIFL